MLVFGIADSSTRTDAQEIVITLPDGREAIVQYRGVERHGRARLTVHAPRDVAVSRRPAQNRERKATS